MCGRKIHVPYLNDVPMQMNEQIAMHTTRPTKTLKKSNSSKDSLSYKKEKEKKRELETHAQPSIKIFAHSQHNYNPSGFCAVCLFPPILSPPSRSLSFTFVFSPSHLYAFLETFCTRSAASPGGPPMAPVMWPTVGLRVFSRTWPTGSPTTLRRPCCGLVVSGRVGGEEERGGVDLLCVDRGGLRGRCRAFWSIWDVSVVLLGREWDLI